VKYYESILDLVGNTPLVRLQKVAAGFRPTILAKLEQLNPGGSVKDRIGPVSYTHLTLPTICSV